MIEIPKFRCWDADTKRMNGMVEIYRNKDNTITILPRGSKITIMQSTGLFDKNGVEIFEGDVVKFEVPETTYTRDGFYTEQVETSGKIVFNRSIGILAIDYGYFKDYEMRNIVKLGRKIEVIGNIYENPELVEETK